MVKKILIFVKKSPFGSVFAAEALRASIAFAGMDLKTKIIFSDEGVFCLNKNQNPKILEMTSLTEGFKNAKEFGLEIFACKNSLKKYNIELNKNYNFKEVKLNEIRGFIDEAEAIICF